MTVTVHGNKEIANALKEIYANLRDDELVLKPLRSVLDDYVPVDTGYLKSHVDRGDWKLDYTAPYSGIVEERQDWAQHSIDAFNIETYANAVVRSF